MKKAFLTRVEKLPTQTMGVFQIYLGRVRIFECKTLELPWKNNERNVSCIPAGVYQVRLKDSPTKGACFEILNVPGRDSILIHKGNFVPKDTQGCILVGNDFGDLNADHIPDLIGSGYALDRLLQIASEGFQLEISAS